MESTKLAFFKFINKHPELGLGAVGGTLGLGATGAAHAGGLLTPEATKNKKTIAKTYLKNTATGAATGAMAGLHIRGQRMIDEELNRHFHDHFRRQYRSGARAATSGMNHREAMRFLGIHGGETTKNEARKKFLRHAAKHHPDVGGDPEMMRKVNAAWEAVKATPWFTKLSAQTFWSGFIKNAVSKAELVKVLKKHEERETPAQEAEESDEEQKIENAAGIHEKDAAQKKKKRKKKKHPPQEVIMFHGHYAAPSCNHHKTLHRVAKKHGITPRVIDVEHDRKETTHHQVRNVPHVVFQRDGQTVGQYTGDKPESHVNAFFKSHVTPPEPEAPVAPPAT